LGKFRGIGGLRCTAREGTGLRLLRVCSGARGFRIWLSWRVGLRPGRRLI